MDSARWLYGTEEMLICRSRQAAHALPAFCTAADQGCTWACLNLRGHEPLLNALWQGCQDPMPQMRHMLAAEAHADVSRLTDQDVRKQVAGRLASGQWMLYRKVRPLVATAVCGRQDAPAQRQAPGDRPGIPTLKRRPEEVPAPPGPDVRPPLPPSRDPTVELHWIEIELIGEDNQPIPFEPYQLAFPSGARIEGRLDDKGFARHERLAEAGAYRICFPQLDKDAWQAAAP